MGLTSSSQTKGNGFSLLEKVKLSFLKMKRKDEGYSSDPAKSGIDSPEGQKWKRRGKTCLPCDQSLCLQAGVDPEFFRPSTSSRLIHFLYYLSQLQLGFLGLANQSL